MYSIYFRPNEESMTNLLAYYSGRRMWRIFSLLSPSEGAKLDPDLGNVPKTKNPYPPSVKLAPSNKSFSCPSVEYVPPRLVRFYQYRLQTITRNSVTHGDVRGVNASGAKPKRGKLPNTR